MSNKKLTFEIPTEKKVTGLMSVNLLDMGQVKVRLIIFRDLDRKF